MKSADDRTQNGFSIIELVVVLAIIGVLTALAVFTFRSSTVDFERQAISREFKIYLERARFDSVKRRAAAAPEQANIVLTSPSSFTAQLDFNEDRALQANETRIVDFSQKASTQIAISDAGLSYPITIRFNQRGHVTATDNLGATLDPIRFTICSSTDCSPTSPNRTVIALSSSGTVAVLRNGQAPAAAPTPTIGNTTPTISCWVVVTNANQSCQL